MLFLLLYFQNVVGAHWKTFCLWMLLRHLHVHCRDLPNQHQVLAKINIIVLIIVIKTKIILVMINIIIIIISHCDWHLLNPTARKTKSSSPLPLSTGESS